MTIDDAILILEGNYLANEDSFFIYSLHEKRAFNDKEWEDLILAIETLSKADRIDNEIIYLLTKIRAIVYDCIISHIDINDLYKIENFENKQYDVREILDNLFDSFFNKHLN